ncbi:MAG TPA: GMC oxidoreductase [Bryobacteraceae bacterium]|nr:GMC oxidoreductase [Bryobacteraceae bacterium]
MAILLRCYARRVAALSFLLLAAIDCRIALAGGNRAASSDDSLHAVHNALFATFLPVDELPGDPGAAALLRGARDAIWQQASQVPQMRELLEPFADLGGFPGSCGLAPILEANHAISFAALSHEQRNQVWLLLQNCAETAPRRLAATVRNFYIVKGYGAVQEQLTGVKLSLFAPPDYVRTHTPRLPPTRLAYDRTRHELTEADGHAIDVLIVGSGPAGSVLAHELRRHHRRVLLVERGSFVVPGSMETRLIDDLLDTRTSSDGAIRIRNGMAVGGGSQVNVDLCFAPTSKPIQLKIESWRQAGRIAPGQFTQPELAAAYEWVKRAIGTRTLSEQEINANNDVLWEGARRAGLHPKLYSLNTYPPGKSPSPVTDKRSAESELLIGALEDRDNPLGMIPDADVGRVLFSEQGENRRAIGVEVRMRAPIPENGVIADPNQLHIPAGESFTIRANTVILSAGALGSPTILLRSGVANDQIGRGVVLHPSMPIMGRFSHYIDVLKGTEASVYVDDHLPDRGYALESMADQPIYAGIMSPGPALHSYEMIKAFRYLAGFGVMLIDTPQADNRLRLDANGNPEIDYTLSEDDKRRFAEGVAEAVRIMFQAGAKEVYLPTTEDILEQPKSSSQQFEPQVFRSADEAASIDKKLRFIPNRTMLSSAHMQATDKMGATPQDSVVGQDFHVWGTQNLFVVDGSVFPTSVGANPMQSIYTIAKIFADHWNRSDLRESAASVTREPR